MPDFGVSLDRRRALEERMFRLGIRDEDILESFVRSKGPGGQNVNKVSTCVHLKHIPTGVEVKCQQERSQALNRYLARELLVGKIEALIQRKLSQERQRIEKARRKKRKRSRQEKLKILEAKRRHSKKKRLRAAVRNIEE